MDGSWHRQATFCSVCALPTPTASSARCLRPAEKREALALLYLFNHELARAREVASQPVLALIRLTWWREVVEGQRKLHEIATPLRDALEAGLFAAEDLAGADRCARAEAEPEIPDLRKFFSPMRAARRAGWRALPAKCLGADSQVVEDLGTAYGIAGILRAAPFLRVQGPFPVARGRHAGGANHAQAQALLGGTAAARARLRRRCRRCSRGAIWAAPYPARTLGDRLAVAWAAFTGRV